MNKMQDNNASEFSKEAIIRDTETLHQGCSESFEEYKLRAEKIHHRISATLKQNANGSYMAIVLRRNFLGGLRSQTLASCGKSQKEKSFLELLDWLQGKWDEIKEQRAIRKRTRPQRTEDVPVNSPRNNQTNGNFRRNYQNNGDFRGYHQNNGNFRRNNQNNDNFGRNYQNNGSSRKNYQNNGNYHFDNTNYQNNGNSNYHRNKNNNINYQKNGNCNSNFRNNNCFKSYKNFGQNNNQINNISYRGQGQNNGLRENNNPNGNYLQVNRTVVTAIIQIENNTIIRRRH